MANPPGKDSAFDPSAVALDLRSDFSLTPHDMTPDFWPRLIGGQIDVQGALVLLLPMRGTPDHWEMHPAGDELLFLLSGKVDVVLELPEGEQVVPLAAKQAFIVPKGVWHTQRVHAPGELLFVTPGEGTQHRPV